LKSNFQIQLLLFLGVLIFLSSCVSHKQMLILQGNTKVAKDSLIVSTVGVHLIQPGDLLDFNISSVSSSQMELFNKEYGSQPTMQGNEATIYLNGHIVNEKGEIELPLIGIVKVSGLTTSEISILVKEKLDTFVKYVTVSTKLTNFKITILGEVRTPGSFTVYNSKISILQALGQAGDITDVGNKKNIKLIRTSEKETYTTVLNLSKSDIINSPYYYLQPNDILYVEPMKIKAVRTNSPTIQVALSLVTLVFLILNFTK
jgi:polysaccharide biosynthesis/export protein